MGFKHPHVHLQFFFKKKELPTFILNSAFRELFLQKYDFPSDTLLYREGAEVLSCARALEDRQDFHAPDANSTCARHPSINLL
jgi:hypothetical protein